MQRPRLFILVFVLFIGACQDRVEGPATDHYPWQINHLPHGHTRIFGIELERTRLNEATAQLGRRYKLALFENTDSKLSLEVYYSEFTRRGLSARLILTLDVTEKLLNEFKQAAKSKEKLLSGVLQYELSDQSINKTADLIIKSMTYLPFANLKEEVVLARFGAPAEKIRTHEQAVHWLYPDKGLDIILSEEGRDILQYVKPSRFESVAKPLRR